jgi:hypothetical protein
MLPSALSRFLAAKCGVERTVGVEPRYSGAKESREQNFSVILNDDLSYVWIAAPQCAHFRIERVVERAVRVEPCQAGMGAPIRAKEGAPDNQLAIRL